MVTIFDQQGFPSAVTQPIGAATAAKHYNDQGFLITPSASPLDARSTQAHIVAQKDVVSSGSPHIVAAADSAASSGIAKTTTNPTGAASRLNGSGLMGAALIVCGLLLVSESFFL